MITPQPVSHQNTKRKIDDTQPLTQKTTEEKQFSSQRTTQEKQSLSQLTTKEKQSSSQLSKEEKQSKSLLNAKEKQSLSQRTTQEKQSLSNPALEEKNSLSSHSAEEKQSFFSLHTPEKKQSYRTVSEKLSQSQSIAEQKHSQSQLIVDQKQSLSQLTTDEVLQQRQHISNTKQKKINGCLFSKVNIYSLKYLVDNFSQEPQILRQKLLKYTKLSQPFCSDIHIDQEFITQEDILFDLSETKDDISQNITFSTTGKKQLELNSQSLFEEITDEQHGNVILKMLEVLGPTLENKAKTTLQELKLTFHQIQSIQNMSDLKTKQFYVMTHKTYEDTEEEESSYPNIKQTLFNSIYDDTMNSIYQIYKILIMNPVNKQNIQMNIDKICQIVDNLQLTEQFSPEQEQVFSYKERCNLLQIKELIQGLSEYFQEKLKHVFDRQFFYWNEFINFHDVNPDIYATFPFYQDLFVNEKYVEMIKNTFCALANSQGGMIFVGIHNVYHRVKAMPLKDIVRLNVIQEIKKISSQIQPTIEYEVKLLGVVGKYKFFLKDINKSAYIVCIKIKQRKPKDIYYFLRNFTERCYLIRNIGYNQRIKPQEIKNLSDQRQMETDLTNCLDYLEYNQNYNPKDNINVFHPDIKEKNNNNNRNPNYNYPNSPTQKELSLIFEEYQQNSGNYENKRLNRNVQQFNSNQLNINQSDKQPQNQQNYQNQQNQQYQQNQSNQPNQSIVQNVLRQTSEFNTNRLRQDINENRRLSCGELSLTNSESNSLQCKNPQVININIDNEFRPSISKQIFLQQRELFFQNPQISLLDNWKKQILKDYLNNEAPTYSDFIESTIVKRFIPQFDQLTSKNCYLIYKIDCQYRVQFKEQISQAFYENQIDNYQYLGNLHNFTVLNIDREKYYYKIEKVITPITQACALYNKVIQGFNFDNFEIKYVQKTSEAIIILEQLYTLLGVEYNIKCNMNRIFVCFNKIQHFMFAYITYLKIKQVFENDLHSNKVYQSFYFPSKY